MLGTASRERLKTWLMWRAQMSIIINCNASMGVQWCVFYLGTDQCVSIPLQICVQCRRRPSAHLILPHFSSLVSKTLATCTSSTLQKAPQARGGLPTSIKYFSLSLFVFSRAAAGLTRLLLSYQQCTLLILNTSCFFPTHFSGSSSSSSSNHTWPFVKLFT